MWHLQRWEAGANNGQGDWVTQESSSDIVRQSVSATYKTGVHGPGEYRFQFELNTHGDAHNVRLIVNDMRILKVITRGEGQILLDPDALDAGLIGSVITGDLAAVGNDTLAGGAGNDILFGDAIPRACSRFVSTY